MEDVQSKENALFEVKKIVKEFPEAYQACVERNLNETELILNNFILSLVF